MELRYAVAAARALSNGQDVGFPSQRWGFDSPRPLYAPRRGRVTRSQPLTRSPRTTVRTRSLRPAPQSNLSRPGPPSSTSSPVPPLSTSAPEPPASESSPAPPNRRSAPAPPVKRFRPAPPSTQSSPPPALTTSSPPDARMRSAARLPRSRLLRRLPATRCSRPAAVSAHGDASGFGAAAGGAVVATDTDPARVLPSSPGGPPSSVVGGPVLAGPVTIHGGSGVVSPARYSKRPRNAGAPPSQC